MSNSTDIFTYFTVPTGRSELLYSAEDWVRIELQLETAGPVAVSTRQDVTPVLSGKGILLPPSGERVQFIMPRGNRLYIASEAVNRVKFIVEPIPWLEQILRQVSSGFAGLTGALSSLLPKRGQPEPQNPKVPGPRMPRIPKIRR